MPLFNILSGWLSMVILVLVLVAAPFQRVFAYASSQWRPATGISDQAVYAPSPAGYFRPVIQQAAPASTRQAFQAVPAFARQYAWRPAPSSWMPKRQPALAHATAHHITSGQSHAGRAPARPQLASPRGQLVMSGRWRPVEMDPNRLASKRVRTSVPARMAHRSTHDPLNVWRPAMQDSRQQRQPAVVQAAPVNRREYAAPSPYSTPRAAAAYAQPAWPYMPMPWMPMHQADYFTGYAAQPATGYARPMPYPFPTAYAPMPPVPYYGQTGRAYPNRRSLSQPTLPAKRRTLANLPPEPLCFGCDS